MFGPFDGKSGVKCGAPTYYHTAHVYFKDPCLTRDKINGRLCAYRGVFLQ